MNHPVIKMPSFDSVGMFFMDFYLMIDVFIWPMFFVFVPTLFMGASFPLITSLAHQDNHKEQVGATVGKVYFFNVLGNVTGGLITGLLLLNVLGTEFSLALLSLVGVCFLFLIKSDRKLFQLQSKILFVALTIFSFFIFFPRPTQLYRAIHYPAIKYDSSENKYITEGLDGVILSYHYQDKLATYINGMPHGGRPNAGFYYEAIAALSYKKQVKNVLVIGFGTGSTTEVVMLLEPKPNVTLIELSPALIENLNKIDYLKSLLDDDKINLIYSDRRKFLYNSDEKFDAIFIDPLRSTTSFSNNLYSKQFFELIKNNLKPDGVFMVWMDEYHVIPKTLATVFPYVHKYSFFAIASHQELKQDASIKDAFFKHFPQQYDDLVKMDSVEKSPIDRAQILKNNTQYPINEDYKPRCEYFIGMSFIKG